jgi:hypothetical protein
VSFHCLLLVVSLCAVLRDRPVAALTTVHAAAASWDWTVTREGINAGGREGDLLARPFVHSNEAIAVVEVVEVAGCAAMGEKTRHSRHRLLRDTWWMWQGVPIVLHSLPQTGAPSWYRR